MLKFGIRDVAQLERASAGGVLASRRFIAVTLYPEVAASDRPDRDALLERILLRFPTANASLKRTQSARFVEFDRAVAQHVRAWAQPGHVHRVHDAGVSDGRTAADFFALLDGIEGFAFELTASDYAPDVLALHDTRGRLGVVIDPRSEAVIQVVRPPFVFNVPQGESPLLYPVNRLVQRLLLAGPVPRLLRRWREGDASVRSETIWLLHPRCEALRRSEPRFRFERHDLMAPFDQQVDVVRAMNVLNRSYFRDEQLAKAVRHVFDALAPGGLFVTGSNQDAGSTVHGAIYRRGPSGFERLHVSGEGSQIDALVIAPEAAA